MIHYVNKEVDEKRHFFHVHTYEDDCKFQKGIEFDTKSYYRQFENYPKRLREEAFEKVRREQFSEYPSRYSCLFMSDSIENAQYWAGKLRPRANNVQCVQVELLSGKYIMVDEHIYDIQHFSNDYMRAEALMYWRGVMTGDPLITLLFDGEFRIDEEFILNGKL